MQLNHVYNKRYNPHLILVSAISIMPSADRSACIQSPYVQNSCISVDFSKASYMSTQSFKGQHRVFLTREQFVKACSWWFLTTCVYWFDRAGMPGDGYWCSGVHGTNCSPGPLVPSMHPPFCDCIVLLPEALCDDIPGTPTLGRHLSLANIRTPLSNNAGKLSPLH